jgi:hypothetical protein
MADVTVRQAAKELALSTYFIYRLPKDTPGLYQYDRALRVNVEELRNWARGQAKKNKEKNNGEK